MPVYDYMCEACGPFTQVHPMSQCDVAQSCPICAHPSPRAFLTAPRFAMMDAGRRAAFATNERSANAPKSARDYAGTHGAGCGCCAPKMTSRTKTAANGAKSFPAARPWMISH